VLGFGEGVGVGADLVVLLDFDCKLFVFGGFDDAQGEVFESGAEFIGWIGENALGAFVDLDPLR